MTKHAVIVDTDSPRYVLVRGKVSDTLSAHGIPGLWSNLARGHWVRRERTSDLLCALQADGFTVRQIGRDPR